MSDSRNIEGRLGNGILEILNMISRIERYGGRGPLRSEHIASFLALDNVELTTLPGAFKTFRTSVMMQIECLKAQGIVSTEPELHCLLDTQESQELKQFSESKQKGRAPLPDLLFFAFQIYPKHIPWRTLSSTDDPLNNMLEPPIDVSSGLYVKITIEPMVFTGILPLNDNPDLENLAAEFLRRASELEKEGILRVRATRLPIHSLSLFPMKAAIDRVGYVSKADVARRYFGNISGDEQEVLQKWYTDYLRYYRTLINRVPDLDMVLGGLMMGKHLVITVDQPGGKQIVREYVSSSLSDIVEIRSAAMSEGDLSLANRWLMRETEIYSKERRILVRHEHPYLQALEDIQRSLRDLRLQRPVLDVTQVTDQSLQAWVQSEINEVRLLARTLNIQEQLSNWMNPLHAYVAYAVDEPQTARRQDGLIAQRFYSAESDQVSVKKVSLKQEKADALFTDAFGSSVEKGRPLSESFSGLVYYLASVLGDPYSTK